MNSFHFFSLVFSSSLHGLILFVTNVFINAEDYQHGRECVYQQLSSKSWKADSSIGQKSSCEEYAPHATKSILGVYSSQYLKVLTCVFYINACSIVSMLLMHCNQLMELRFSILVWKISLNMLSINSVYHCDCVLVFSH